MAQLTDLPNLAPATNLSPDDLVPVWDNFDTRSPKRTTIAELLALGAVTVTDDAAKLALTGIKTGQVVIIADQGNRVEMYVGGTISAQSSWAVLRNTIQLSVAILSGSGNTVLINGVVVGSTFTSVGWVDPQSIPFAALSNTTLTLVAQTTARTDQAWTSNSTPPSTSIAVQTTTQNFALPLVFPHRGIVTLSVTYPSV